MKILALDTSTMMGSIAILDDDQVVAEHLLNVNVTHSERLIPSVDLMLEQTNLSLDDMDGFGVAIGPGSFTGLRIGLGAIKGFCFGVDKPVVGVSSLEALAYNAYGLKSPVVSLLDARRGEYYIAIYNLSPDGGSILLKEQLLSPEAVLDQLESLKQDFIVVGDGLYRLKDEIVSRVGEKFIVPPASMIHTRASNIASLALKRFKAGDVDNIDTLAPNYIRKSDAELTKKK